MDKGLDLKILFSFIHSYKKLHEEGVISEEELEKIQDILDHLEKYSPVELQEKLAQIFAKNK